MEPGLVRRVTRGPTVGTERQPRTRESGTVRPARECSVLEAAVRRKVVCESKCRKELNTRSETMLEKRLC